MYQNQEQENIPNESQHRIYHLTGIPTRADRENTTYLYHAPTLRLKMLKHAVYLLRLSSLHACLRSFSMHGACFLLEDDIIVKAIKDRSWVWALFVVNFSFAPLPAQLELTVFPQTDCALCLFGFAVILVYLSLISNHYLYAFD